MTTENVLYFALVKGSLPIFETKFLVEGMSMDSSLFSGTLTAIQMLSQQVSNRDVKVIDQGDLKIIIEHGNHLFGVTLTSGDSEHIRNKLKQAVMTFENEYKEFLTSTSLFNIDEFSDFKKVVVELFAEEIIKPYFIPYFSDKKPSDLIYPDSWTIITLIDGKRNISEIIKQSKLDNELVNNVLGNLNANGLIKFKVDINLYDLPILTTKGSQMLLNKDMRRYFETNYGSNWINIFKSIDGQKTLKTLSNIIETNIIQFKKLITDFLGKGYIELLSEKLEQVIIIEDLYKKYYDAVNKLFGKKGKNYFKDALNKYPESYIELVIVETDELFSFSKIKSFVEAGNVNDTDLIIEALLIPMKNINDTIHSFLGEKQKLKKREEILSQLETIYGEKLNFLKEFFYQVD